MKPLHRRLLTAGCIAIMLCIAVWRYFTIPAPVRELDGRTSDLTLEAADFAEETSRNVSVRLNGVDGVLRFSGDYEFTPGDRITGQFRITLGYRSGSHFTATPYDEFTVTQGSPRITDYPAIWANAIKERIAALYQGDGAALLTGILTGDRGGFSDALQQSLFSAGMTHVAAVSGLHVSILAGFAALVFRSRRRSVLAALPLIFVYIAVTGFTPSAMRAGIMIAVFLFAPFIGREYTPLRALVFAFLLICMINPYAVFTLSLQLSFLATLGLLLFASRWNKAFLSRLAGLLFLPGRKYIAAALSSSLAALVFSLPLAAYSFGGVSLLSPLTNTALLWSVSVIFILGAFSLMLPFLAWVAGPFITLFISATGLTAKIPYAVLYTTQPYLTAWLLYAYILFVTAMLARRWKPSVILAVSSFALCLTLTIWRDHRFRLEIAVLDVGQGQCVIVRSGSETAVIDCGGNAYAGQTAARYLQSRGVNSIDWLLLTHYDNDHINGVPSLLSVVNTEHIAGPALDALPEAYAVDTISEDITFTLGKAELTLIPARWFGDNNEQCLSVLVTLDGFAFLTTGDLGQATERWLLRWSGMPPVDVLTAGHHGSASSTSAELLDALEPAAAVISVGINRYGHPSEETLSRLLDRDIAVYRTDTSGTVTIRF